MLYLDLILHEFARECQALALNHWNRKRFTPHPLPKRAKHSCSWTGSVFYFCIWGSILVKRYLYKESSSQSLSDLNCSDKDWKFTPFIRTMHPDCNLLRQHDKSRWVLYTRPHMIIEGSPSRITIFVKSRIQLQYFMPSTFQFCFIQVDVDLQLAPLRMEFSHICDMIMYILHTVLDLTIFLRHIRHFWEC